MGLFGRAFAGSVAVASQAAPAGSLRRATRTAGPLLLVGALLWVGFACSGSKPKAAEAPPVDDSGPPPACREDEIREYFCDDLLPFASEKPAPDPYETCPGNVDVKASVFPATSSLARFDVPRTEWTRKRVPPGHSCCYSWCSKLASAEEGDVDAAACQQPNVMREKLCLNEAEAGVSDGAAAPYDRCAAAIKPPAAVSFSTPKAAALDLQLTGQLRAQGIKECCYGWCSKAPVGTGLGSK